MARHGVAVNPIGQFLTPDVAVLEKTDRNGLKWYAVVTERTDVKISVEIPDAT